MATKLNRDGQAKQPLSDAAALADLVGQPRPAAVDLMAVDMSGAGTYRKPHTIRAVQLDPNGGDWVAEDEKGNRWVIAHAVFLQNYTRV